MSRLPTIPVKREGEDGYRLINESDFDPKLHKRARVPKPDASEDDGQGPEEGAD